MYNGNRYILWLLSALLFGEIIGEAAVVAPIVAHGLSTSKYDANLLR